MARDDWERLIDRYADGRPICNCRQAYYSPTGHGIVNGVERTDILDCEYGCSANQISAKRYIATRVLQDPSVSPAQPDQQDKP